MRRRNRYLVVTTVITVLGALGIANGPGDDHPHYSANISIVTHRIEKAIDAKASASFATRDARCGVPSNQKLTCRAIVTSPYGTGVATYHVVVNKNGSYSIDHLASIRVTSTRSGLNGLLTPSIKTATPR